MSAAAPAYDRTAEDLGNIVLLEHLNVRQNDQRLATLFYVAGLGLTRDPYMQVSDVNMWVNCGRQQFHMPTGEPQRLRGAVGMVVPDLDALAARLAAVREKLAATKFSFTRRADEINATCPWGNRFRIHGPEARFGGMRLGIAYVELMVPLGTAAGIARFYRTLLLAPARLQRGDAGESAQVAVGANQRLVFRETRDSIPAYDGHHIAVYIANFSGPHAALARRGLVSEESDRWQYRFSHLVDPDSGAELFELEHEVRSLTHPLFARPLVNRNPAQTQLHYSAGRDAFW